MEISKATLDFSVPVKSECLISKKSLGIPPEFNPPHRPKEPVRIAIDDLMIDESIRIDCDSDKKIESIRCTAKHSAKLTGKKFCCKKLNGGFSIRIWRVK